MLRDGEWGRKLLEELKKISDEILNDPFRSKIDTDERYMIISDILYHGYVNGEPDMIYLCAEYLRILPAEYREKGRLEELNELCEGCVEMLYLDAAEAGSDLARAWLAYSYEMGMNGIERDPLKGAMLMAGMKEPLKSTELTELLFLQDELDKIYKAVDKAYGMFFENDLDYCPAIYLNNRSARFYRLVVGLGVMNVRTHETCRSTFFNKEVDWDDTYDQFNKKSSSQKSMWRRWWRLKEMHRGAKPEAEQESADAPNTDAPDIMCGADNEIEPGEQECDGADEYDLPFDLNDPVYWEDEIRPYLPEGDSPESFRRRMTDEDTIPPEVLEETLFGWDERIIDYVEPDDLMAGDFWADMPRCTVEMIDKNPDDNKAEDVTAHDEDAKEDVDIYLTDDYWIELYVHKLMIYIAKNNGDLEKGEDQPIFPDSEFWKNAPIKRKLDIINEAIANGKLIDETTLYKLFIQIYTD